MAYDRYESRRDWREARPRWRDDNRDFRGERGGFAGRDRDDERGWFERAGDEIASWFGDEDRERGRGRGRPEHQDRGYVRSHLRNEDDVQRFYGERGRDRDFGRRPADRAFMSDEDFGRFEQAPRWRDEGYRRPYTGRATGRPESTDFGPERGGLAALSPPTSVRNAVIASRTDR